MRSTRRSPIYFSCKKTLFWKKWEKSVDQNNVEKIIEPQETEQNSQKDEKLQILGIRLKGSWSKYFCAKNQVSNFYGSLIIQDFRLLQFCERKYLFSHFLRNLEVKCVYLQNKSCCSLPKFTNSFLPGAKMLIFGWDMVKNVFESYSKHRHYLLNSKKCCYGFS